MHVGVANLNVDNHVGRILSEGRFGRPFPLISGGDLLLLVRRLVQHRGRHSTQINKVKGDADESMVALGRVREIHRVGNDEADAAADMGRRCVYCSNTDARHLFDGACGCLYPDCPGAASLLYCHSQNCGSQ